MGCIFQINQDLNNIVKSFKVNLTKGNKKNKINSLEAKTTLYSQFYKNNVVNLVLQ